MDSRDRKSFAYGLLTQRIVNNDSMVQGKIWKIIDIYSRHKVVFSQYNIVRKYRIPLAWEKQG